MLNYKNWLYHDIGRRIKVYRECLGMTQGELAKFLLKQNTSLLSKIENGKVDKRRNPYLLPKDYIKDFSNTFSIQRKELVWGVEQNCERFVKIVLLAILMNGIKYKKDEMNPFICNVLPEKAKSQDSFCEEYYEWAVKQPFIDIDFCNDVAGFNLFDKTLSKEFSQTQPQKFDKADSKRIDKQKKEYQKKFFEKSKKLFANEYGFFFNYINYEDYTILQNGYDKDYEELSNLLLKYILHDAEFMQSFITRLCNISTGLKPLPNNSANIYNIDDYIKGKGQYGLIALDYKERDYHIFIKAFNKFWRKNKMQLMMYFNKHLFKDDEYKWLKPYNDEFFHGIFCSSELISLIRQYEQIGSSYNIEAIIANNYQLAKIHESLFKEHLITDKGKNEKKNAFFSYISHIREDTDYFIKTFITPQSKQ